MPLEIEREAHIFPTTYRVRATDEGRTALVQFNPVTEELRLVSGSLPSDATGVADAVQFFADTELEQRRWSITHIPPPAFAPALAPRTWYQRERVRWYRVEKDEWALFVRERRFPTTDVLIYPADPTIHGAGPVDLGDGPRAGVTDAILTFGHENGCAHRRRRHAQLLELFPRFCRQCDGWGLKVSRFDPSPAGVSLAAGSMEDVALCSACVELGICPRCGLQWPDPHAIADGASGCPFCQWAWGDVKGDTLPNLECFCQEARIANGEVCGRCENAFIEGDRPIRVQASYGAPGINVHHRCQLEGDLLV